MQTKFSEKILCVDIGGTKTAFSCFDKQGNELFYDRFGTDSASAETLVERVFQSTKGNLDGVVKGVIASPGPLDMDRGWIKHIATMGWKSVPIVKLFEEKFGIPFFLLNDCDAGALGVWRFCGFEKCRCLAYISVSTGIGGGIVLDGKLLTGKGNSANFGHIPVVGEGIICGCGQLDCLELYASGSGIEKRYENKTGKTLNCADIAKLAFAGEEIACNTFKEASDKLIFGLKCIVATIDPEIIVFGGSVCKSKELFMPTIQKEMPDLSIEYAPEDGKQVLYGALAYGLLN